MSYVAIQFMEPQYESSTAIMVEESGSINPALVYDVEEEQENTPAAKLERYDQVTMSRSTIEVLIDSLGYDAQIQSEKDKRGVVNGLRGRITTEMISPDAYEITFASTDPEEAKRGAEILSNQFLRTQETLTRRRNDETVTFFEQKLEDMEALVNDQRNRATNSSRQRMAEVPSNPEALQGELRTINERLSELDWQIYQTENRLEVVRSFVNQDEGEFSAEPLYRLSMDEVPHGEELSELIDEYDELNDRYTESYPGLQRVKNRIRNVANRIPNAIESNLAQLREQQEDLRQERNEVTSDMEQSYVASQQDARQQSSVNTYQEMYDELRQNLEEARMNRDMSDRSAAQYQVISASYLPDSPSSPNVTLIMAAAAILGLVVGLMLMVMAEALDNTIRTEADFEFDEPVIAYLSEGS